MNAMNEHAIWPLSVKLVIFDLDGTLVDTAPDLATSANDMRRELGMRPYARETIARWIGNGASRLVKRALTGDMEGEPDKDLYERAFPMFLKYYAKNLSRESRLYAGVCDGLAALQTAGFDLACITNKPEAFTVPLLKDVGLYDYFKLILSGDTLHARKPDPLPLLHACKHFNVEPSQALLVGDSMNDASAAQAAGMPVICVTYGYNQGVDVRDLDPEGIVDSLRELPSYIRLDS